jgi:LmbE family N-acetylglucosaminyl deacetylase
MILPRFSQRGSRPAEALGLLLALASPAIAATNVSNVDMTFAAGATYLWSGTYDWPDAPDQGPVTSADFLFSDSLEHVWKLNNGAAVILTQTGSQGGGRFFVGSGGDGVLTFTSDAGAPGKISARYNAYAAMRIGELPGNHSGTVRIEGGVTFETGWIFGEGNGTRAIHINDGLFAVFSDNTSKRLNHIDVTLGPDGSLWVQDGSAAVTSVASFQTFAPGATLQATGGTLVFTNNQPRAALVGGTINGTLITVAPPLADPTLAIADPQQLAHSGGPGVLTVPFSNAGASQALALTAPDPVSISGPDAGFFSVGAYDANLAPGATGAITLAFDPTLPGGGPRSYAAILSIASNDSAEPIRQVILQVTAYAAVPGLVSHFTFDDPAQPGRDLGTFANHGTALGNAAHSGDARIGTGSLALDGSGDLLDLGVSSGADYTTTLVGDGDGFTLACWAFIPNDAPTGFTRFFSTYTPAGYVAQGWGAGYGSSSRMLGTTYGLVDYFSSSNIMPPRGEWHHFAYVFRNAPVSRVDHYVNGSLASSASSANAGLNPATSVGFAIGCLGLPNGGQFFRGRLDDLRVYDRELSPAEIAALIPPDSDPDIVTAPDITLPDRYDAEPVDFVFEIENAGVTQDLIVPAASLAGTDAAHFSVLTDLSTPLVIPPGMSVALDLRFDPAGGFRTFLAELWVSSNDSNEPLRILPVSARTIPPPPRVPLLFVHAHADDESIFGGGVLPYYAQTRDLPVAVVSIVTRNPNGSSPITSGSTSRIAELRRAMDVYAGQAPGSGVLTGTDYHTGNIVQTNVGFIDTGCCSVPPDDSWSDAGDGHGWGLSSGVTQVTPGFGNTNGFADGRLAASWAVARQIRRYRPDVVVTCHDLEGDYGHSNHTATAIACIEATTLAADPATDIDGLPPWQTQKLYLRGGPSDNRDTISYVFNDPLFPGSFTSNGGIHPLFHDFFEEPTISGQTPRQVADAGLDQHVSQGNLDVSTVFRSGESFNGHHSEWWTLYQSNIGPDTIEPGFTVAGDTTATTYSGWARGDFFDNLVVFADRDFDGLADVWEIEHFGSLTAAGPAEDDDGDGRNNLAEFISGTDPLVFDAIPLALSSDAETITFTVPPAAGPGYEGLARHWRLVSSPDLEDWSTVVAEGIASGSPLNLPLDTVIRGFYRLELELR